MSLRDTLAPEANDDPRVVQLDARRARRRLEHLLDLRNSLAQLSGERRSHRLDDAGEVFGQQMAVEQTIQREFPRHFDQSFADWMRRDAGVEHEPGTLCATCGICQAIARRGGINLTPPEVA